MKIRIHNNDGTDYVDYEGGTIEDIKEQCNERIKLPTWDKGWSEQLRG